MKRKKKRMENQEDEPIGGDGVLTMRGIKKV